MKCTKIPPFSPNDDRQATAARLAIFDHHLNRLQLSFPVMSRLMSPGYSLLDDDAPEASMASQLKTISTIQELPAEASDAGARKDLIQDGKSGDVNFTHGHFHPILTFGGCTMLMVVRLS
jgi:hypothetical protein